MHQNESFQITGRALKYILIYGLFVLLPFFFCLKKTGMTCVIGKTFGFGSQPLLLLAWLADLDFYKKYFSLITTTNIIMNIFILFWLGSLIERKNE